jgi:hypothetical protein
MPSEDASPSAGWREVYDAMATETDDGADLRTDGAGDRPRTEPCPDCGAVPGVDGGDVCCESRAGAVREGDDGADER